MTTASQASIFQLAFYRLLEPHFHLGLKDYYREFTNTVKQQNLLSHLLEEQLLLGHRQYHLKTFLPPPFLSFEEVIGGAPRQTPWELDKTAYSRFPRAITGLPEPCGAQWWQNGFEGQKPEASKNTQCWPQHASFGSLNIACQTGLLRWHHHRSEPEQSNRARNKIQASQLYFFLFVFAC